MKLLLDEMLSPDTAEQLRARGHDVQAIAASEHAERDDPEVVELARSQQRAVVTNNVRDFRPLHIAAVQPGRTKADIGGIVAALEAKLRAYPGLEDLANAEEWL